MTRIPLKYETWLLYVNKLCDKSLFGNMPKGYLLLGVWVYVVVENFFKSWKEKERSPDWKSLLRMVLRLLVLVESGTNMLVLLKSGVRNYLC